MSFTRRACAREDSSWTGIFCPGRVLWLKCSRWSWTPYMHPPNPLLVEWCLVRLFFGDARVSDETWAKLTIDRGCWLSKGAVIARQFEPGHEEVLSGWARRLRIELTGDATDVVAKWSCGREGCVDPRHYEVLGEWQCPGGPMPTHICRRGHEYVRENVYTSPTGAHECRVCRRTVWEPAAKERRARGEVKPRKPFDPMAPGAYGPAIQKLASAHGFDVEERLLRD